MPYPFYQFFIFKPSCDALNLKEEKNKAEIALQILIQVVREYQLVSLFLAIDPRQYQCDQKGGFIAFYPNYLL